MDEHEAKQLFNRLVISFTTTVLMIGMVWLVLPIGHPGAKVVPLLVVLCICMVLLICATIAEYRTPARSRQNKR